MSIGEVTIKRDRLIVVFIWLGTRLLTLGAVVLGAWSALAKGDAAATYIELWTRWDTNWFKSIVVYGYVGPYTSEVPNYHYNVAFFPGFPMLMSAGTWLGLDAVAAGLIVSATAALVASLAIARIGEGIGARGPWVVTAFLIAPTALFLTAAYSEALFCAFAFWAWVLGRKGSWVWAGVLAGGAALVRSNGLFLMLGLILMFLMARPWQAARPVAIWCKGLALLLPLVATVGYFAYLKAITGNWMAWSDAESEYWERHLVDPITALANTYRLIWTFSPTGGPSSRMVTEIVAMVLILVFTGILVVKRWWPEAVYTFATAVALGTSTMYHSVPRAIVVLFPVWMLVGLWLTRHRWFRWVYVIGCLPLLILVTIRFTQDQWIS